MNKDEDGDGGAATFVPPPKSSDMNFRSPTMDRVPQPAPPAATHSEDVPAMDASKLLTGSNMFKLPKGRNMRANYVDVMNPGGSKSTASSNMLTPVTSPLVPMATSSPQLFVPAPSKSRQVFQLSILFSFIRAEISLKFPHFFLIFLGKCNI